MSDKSRLRDRVWPEVTNSVWGAERIAVRLYMKEEWRNRFEEEIIPNSTSGLTEIEVAEIEAREILKWWRSRFPEEWKPETDSWEFANWMLRKYHDDLEEREKVDGFDHRVYGPRGN